MISNETVAHNWVHNIKEHLRSNSMFWENNSDGTRSIYSYGYHYCIATLDPVKKVILFNTLSYSNTTAKHQNAVRWAFHGLDYKVIDVPNLKHSVKDTLKEYADKICTLAGKLSRSKVRGSYYLQCINETIETAKEYASYLKVSKRDFKPVQAVIDAFNAENTKDSLNNMLAIQEENRKKEEAKQAAKRREEERIRQLESSKRLELWEAGKTNYLSWYDTEENVPLRLKAKKGYIVIETGRGVFVPLIEAKRIANLVLAGDLGGLIVNGVYHLRSCNNTDVQIGCHCFKMSYLKDFANKVLAL